MRWLHPNIAQATLLGWLALTAEEVNPAGAKFVDCQVVADPARWGQDG